MPADRNREMKLRWLMSPTGNHPAAWLHPSAALHSANNFAHYVQLVRKAEAAKFHFVFQADAAGARDGNMHRGRPKQGIFPMVSHLGTMGCVIAGALLARRLRGTLQDVVGATSIGDGGTSTGAFHEGMNMAAVERLPMVVLVVNNQYAYSTPTSRQFACADLLDRAAGYGFAGHEVDGTDLSACLGVVQSAVAAARSGQGPQMVVARLLRLTGHGEHDDASYVDPALRASAVGGDCLKLARQQILARDWAQATDLDAWRAKCISQVDAAVATAQSDAPPDPQREDWTALSTRHLNGPSSEP